MSYNKMKIAVGIFVLTLFIATSSFIFMVLDEKGTFDKRYTYFFETDSAKSFSVGMPLSFSGFDIGVIDKIALKDDGTVEMSFSVTEENKKWISKDSVLLVKKPLIGSPYIEIYSALGNPPLKSGSTLMLVMSDDINDMISKFEPVVNKITNIIDNIDSLMARITKEDSDIIKTVENIQLFTAKLAKNDALLTTITGDADSTNSLIASLNDIALIINDFKNISSSIDSDIVKPSSGAIKELELIMKDIKQKLDSLDSTVKVVGTLDSDIIGLKEQISVGITKSNQIMDKIDSVLQDKSSSEVVLP